MSAVHDLAEEVPQILPGDPVVGLQVVEEDVGADDEVARVERVRLVPPLRSEFPPLRDDGVEVAEREEDALQLRLLGAHLEGVLGARFNCM